MEWPLMFGVLLLSLLTANVAAFFIGGDAKKAEPEENEADLLLKAIFVRLQRVERLLEEQQAAKKS